MGKVGVFDPGVIENSKDIILGEGILKFDGTADGATRGGSSIEIDKELKDVNFDGAYGSVKGIERYTKFIPKLKINFLNLTASLLQKCVPGTLTEDLKDEDGDYDEFALDLEITSAHVISDLTFNGQKLNGDSCVADLKNAVNIDSFSLDFKEKDEITSEMIFTGFYAYATPTTPPIDITEEE
jgi:hypothetical protein